MSFLDNTGLSNLWSKTKGLFNNSITNLSVKGKIITFTKGNGTTGTIETQDTDTTYNIATPTQPGLLSAEDKEKLDTVKANAAPNTVTGVKGSSNTDYKIGQVNLSASDVGAVPKDKTAVTTILSSVYTHNSIYGGRDLTSYTNEQIHNAVSANNFILNDGTPILVGDFFNRSFPATTVTAQGPDNQDVTFTRSVGNVTFYVAHINYFCTTGDTSFGNTPHLVLIANIGSCKMNATNVTTGGYNSCAVNKILQSKEMLTSYQSALGSSYIKTGWRNLPSTAIGADGQSSNWAWNPCNFTLLSESAVFGGHFWGDKNRGYDSGIMPYQFAIFRYNPRVIGRVAWWLCSVWSSTAFCLVFNFGNANSHGASHSLAMVPLCIFI